MDLSQMFNGASVFAIEMAISTKKSTKDAEFACSYSLLDTIRSKVIDWFASFVYTVFRSDQTSRIHAQVNRLIGVYNRAWQLSDYSLQCLNCWLADHTASCLLYSILREKLPPSEYLLQFRLHIKWESLFSFLESDVMVRNKRWLVVASYVCVYVDRTHGICNTVGSSSGGSRLQSRSAVTVPGNL